MSKLSVEKSISFINRHGVLLVFPIKGRLEPRSLWSCFYPKKEMVWEWSDDVDTGVVQLWHLRTELSLCEEVIYSKWFQGRATLFSRAAFISLLVSCSSKGIKENNLTAAAVEILAVLEDNSPLPTRQLREEVGLSGKENEATFTKAMNVLWRYGLIVGAGEKEEGGFPCLCVGATQVLKEDLWDEAAQLSQGEESRVAAIVQMQEIMGPGTALLRAFNKICHTS